jgi:hypothetical protein
MPWGETRDRCSEGLDLDLDRGLDRGLDLDLDLDLDRDRDLDPDRGPTPLPPRRARDDSRLRAVSGRAPLYARDPMTTMRA